VKIRILVAVLALVAAISGCSSSGNAILQTLPYAYGRNPGVDNARLNPNFQYLRVTVSGRVALLALGDVDKHPLGPIEVWYSAEREVLRLQNGRLTGAVGLTTEWRNVILPELPSWAAAVRADRKFEWTRIRDVMPGYRFGVKDRLALSVVAAPAKSALLGLDPQKLIWFEERVETESGGRFSAILGKAAGANAPLPPSLYAVEFRDGLETVVYGEQCLDADLCFSWQRWPVPAQSSAGQK
jgi:hypothetical protein